MTDALDTGLRVLAALERGREQINAERRARAEHWARVIRAELDVDILREHGDRGRAGRIKRRAKIPLSVRQVKRYLDTLSSVSGSVVQAPTND